jgi:type IV pilus assembly protein PilW
MTAATLPLLRAHAPRARQRGLTLMEMMVAMVLGLFIVIALLALLSNVNRNNSELTKTNHMIENGRFAMQLLAGDLQHAGYFGGFVPKFDDLSSSSAPTDVPTAVPNPCTTVGASWDAAFVNNMVGLPVSVHNITSPVPAATALPVCPGASTVVASPKANSDVLVVRHVEQTSCTAGTAGCPALGEVYMQVPSCMSTTAAGYSASPYLLTTTATANSTATFNLKERDCTTAAQLRKLVQNIYYVRTYSSTSGDGVPTLMRSQFTAGTQQPAEALIENIEGFRVEVATDEKSDSGAALTTASFGSAISWSNTSNLTSATNRGDGLPDGSCTTTAGTPCGYFDLMNAVALKVYVLVRAEAKTGGYTDSKVYCLGSSCTPTVSSCPASAANAQPMLGPFCDGYKRHLFTQTIRLNNVSMRRETP